MKPVEWFVIRTIPVHRIEFSVLHALNQREHPAMVPFEEKKLRKHKQRDWRTERYPLFACYVFAGFEGFRDFIEAREAINAQAERMGKKPPILGAVGYRKDKPAVLTEREVGFLRSLSAPRATAVNLHKAIRPGTEISILDGPFAGHRAVVDSMTRKGVRAMLYLFNTMHLVEIKAAAMEAA